VVHFSAVLFIAMILSAPWPALSGAGLALDVCAVLGLVYAVIVVLRARRQTDYVPVLEDWVWQNVLPLQEALLSLFVRLWSDSAPMEVPRDGTI
jgi:hypothetical protein